MRAWAHCVTQLRPRSLTSLRITLPCAAGLAGLGMLHPGDLISRIYHQAALQLRPNPTSLLHLTPEGGRLYDVLPT